MRNSRTDPASLSKTVLRSVLPIVAILCLSATCRAAEPAAGKAAEPDKAAPAATVVIQALELGSKKPVADATVWVNADEVRQSLKTDAEGRCRIGLTKARPGVLWIELHKEGLFPNSVTWYFDKPSLVVPESYTMEMHPRRALDGIVRDLWGAPVAGAVVSMFVLRAANPALEKKSTRMTFSVSRTKTDANGKWHSDDAPVDLGSLPVRVEHPDFAVMEITGLPAPQPDRQDRFLETVLVKGVRIEGTVRNEAGQPIAHAKVTPDPARRSACFDEPLVSTDAEGHYVIPQAAKREWSIIFQAEGYGPTLRQFQAADKMAQMDIVLPAGRSLRGRVVDQAGAPLPEVMIFAGAWRGLHGLDFQATTDAEGRFTWSGAPEDEVQFDLATRDDRMIRARALKASPDEQTIVLERP